MNKELDEFYINKCFDLAIKGAGNVSPNPLVGAIIVNDGRIIGSGYHKKYGEAHAEVNAINSVKKEDRHLIEGSTLYCNLEPCVHTNKQTPPCAQMLIKNKIGRVVVSNLDPNPQVSGKGLELLKDYGMNITTDILTQKGNDLNEIFFKNIQKNQPFFHLKMAQTLDGKMASSTFDSKWISCELSREWVHLQREKFDAVLVGANTVLQDNPKLTARNGNTVTKCPIRLVFSRKLNFTFKEDLFTDEYASSTYIIAPQDTETDFKNIIRCPLIGKEFDLNFLEKKLYEMGIRSVFVEGGSYVFTSFMKQKKYDRISVFISPQIIGDGIAPINNLEINIMKESVKFNTPKWIKFDQDLLFTGTRQ